MKTLDSDLGCQKGTRGNISHGRQMMCCETIRTECDFKFAKESLKKEACITFFNFGLRQPLKFVPY